MVMDPHTSRGPTATETGFERSVACGSDGEYQSEERTHAGAGSRRHPAQWRQAVAEQGRRGIRARWCGNKGRAAPVACVIVRGVQLRQRVHQLCLPGLLETTPRLPVRVPRAAAPLLLANFLAHNFYLEKEGGSSRIDSGSHQLQYLS